MRIGFVVAAIAVALVVGVGQVRGDLVNPGFETEGTGGTWDAAGWTQASHTERYEWGSHDAGNFLMALVGFSFTRAHDEGTR